MRLLFALLAACSYAPHLASDEAGVPPGGEPPAPMEAGGPDCFASWKNHNFAMTTPVPVVNVNSIDDDRDPFVTTDELTLLFTSHRAGTQGIDVFIATRTAVDQDFTNPQPATDFNSAEDDIKAAISQDGLTAIVASRRPGGEGMADLWLASRTVATDPLVFVQDGLQAVNDDQDQKDVFLTADGNTLYYSQGNPQHIAIATRQPGAAFDTPASVIDSGSGDADAALSPDQLVIVFTSRRDLPGLGGDNLWYATRSAIGEDFGVAEPVPTVNTTNNDGDAVFSQDGCRMYFSVDGGTAAHEIVMSELR